MSDERMRAEIVAEYAAAHDKWLVELRSSVAQVGTPQEERVAEAIFWAECAFEGADILGRYEFLRDDVKAKNRYLARAAIAAISPVE